MKFQNNICMLDSVGWLLADFCYLVLMTHADHEVVHTVCFHTREYVTGYLNIVDTLPINVVVI